MKTLVEYMNEDRIRSVKGSVTASPVELEIRFYEDWGKHYFNLDEVCQYIVDNDKLDETVNVYDDDNGGVLAGYIDIERNGSKLVYKGYDNKKSLRTNGFMTIHGTSSVSKIRTMMVDFISEL